MDAEFINTIICPSCHAELGAADDICGSCGASTTASTGTTTTVTAPAAAGSVLDRPWLLIILVLHVGCLGIPMYWKTKYSVGTRLVIIVASIVYTVAAVGFIYWMLRWLVTEFSA